MVVAMVVLIFALMLFIFLKTVFTQTKVNNIQQGQDIRDLEQGLPEPGACCSECREYSKGKPRTTGSGARMPLPPPNY